MNKVIDWIFYLALRVLNATYRYRIYNTPYRDEAERNHPRKVIAIATWHGDSLAGTLSHAWQRFSPLCSRSRDGSMVAFVCERIGLRPARGSSSRGGKEARDELLDLIEQGYSPAITVDGPRGPRHEVKAGIIDIARKGRVAILPLITRGDRYWTLTKSWDRMQIPKPFARVAACYGPPVFVDPDAEGSTFASLQSEVKKRLESLEEEASNRARTWDGEGYVKPRFYQKRAKS